MAKPALRPIQLLAASVVMGVVGVGCMEPLSIDDRHCPCSDGYICCKSTNICLAPQQSCPLFEAVVEPPVVLQGEVVTLRVTGTDLAHAGDVALGDLLVGSPSSARNEMFQMVITIPHGTSIGAKDLHFTTQRGGKTYEAKAVVTVSPISVASNGDDRNTGTTDRPFATLEHALLYARGRDTIHLGPGSYGMDADPFARIYLPAGLTLEGEAASRAQVSGPVVMSGDAVLRNLILKSRAEVTGVNSKVTVEGVAATGRTVGVTVDGFATGATVVISGKSDIQSGFDPPVFWQADEGKLSIVDSALSNSYQDSEAMRLDGDNLRVEITGSSIRSSGANAVASFRRNDVVIDHSFFQGIVDLMGGGTTAEIANSTFQISSETRATGGVSFFGQRLDITDCKFNVVGLLQSAPNSTVTVRRTKFAGYRDPAVILQGGTLDLGTMNDPGANQFQTGDFVSGMPPVALKVAAATGGGSASFSATTVDGQAPTPGWIMGPATESPYYQIAEMVPIYFY
jgi:hypothetical protein